jgi:hypothetical protein
MDNGDSVLKWLAVVVPGISAGLGWSATAGWPPMNRILAGIAVGVVIYAVIHFVMKALNRNHD